MKMQLKSNLVCFDKSYALILDYYTLIKMNNNHDLIRSKTFSMYSKGLFLSNIVHKSV